MRLAPCRSPLGSPTEKKIFTEASLPGEGVRCQGRRILKFTTCSYSGLPTSLRLTSNKKRHPGGDAFLLTILSGRLGLLLFADLVGLVEGLVAEDQICLVVAFGLVDFAFAV